MIELVALCLIASGQPTERPTVNVPYALRQENWIGRQGEGSCVHATMISLLRWQGRYNTADWMRRNWGDGEWNNGVEYAAKLDGAGVRYAYTNKGDIRFLQWACQTRRGCGIAIKGGAHMVALVHFGRDWSAVLDNNDVSRYYWIPTNKLIAEWKAAGGWAVTPVYSPAAPLPRHNPK